MPEACVVGAGLAGCEAAWQLARRGIGVKLFEMRPVRATPAHKTGDFAELVCSNSLRSADTASAVGLLKEEMRKLGSIIISCADQTRVEAGGALAVDRQAFAGLVTKTLGSHPNISVVRQEVTAIPGGSAIIATGPLTEGALAEDILNRFGGEQYLSFYDAAAPLISFESIDLERAWFASRYGKSGDDYINCPLDKERYISFVSELARAGQAEVHGFEDRKVFEGCMPVEVMARRGEETLRFGPMKPVGLRDPSSGRKPYAVVQLRKDNAAGSVYNLVGFQTHLTFPEQKRVFSMIPALENAEFLRYGVMHRNSFIRSPLLLDDRYRSRSDPRTAFAGQLTGVEGYVESAASGLYAAISLCADIAGTKFVPLPPSTAIGALAHYVSGADPETFQPMNINYGIISPLEERVRGKRERNLLLAARSLKIIDSYIEGTTMPAPPQADA